MLSRAVPAGRAGRPRLRRTAIAAITTGCVACLAAPAPPVSAAPVSAPALPTTGPARLDAARFGRSAASHLVRELHAAWQITRGRGVTVAVIGQGVDPSTIGFSGRVTTGPSFGNVRHDDLAPDTVFASAVAGAWPVPQNPSGTMGLAPQARILSLRVPGHTADDSWQPDDTRAIRYAARHGARVIFVDLIGTDDDRALAAAVQYAESKSAVVIADEFPVGSDRNEAEYPASLPGVLGATSVLLPGLVEPPRRGATPANQSILVAAPGNVLYVAGPAGSGYGVFNSLAAAAWLTATVALIKSAFPSLPPALVARAIAVSARYHPRRGYSTRAGFGLINPVGALHAAAGLAKLPARAAPGPGVQAPRARFTTGPAPGVIGAVHHSTAKLAGFAAAMAAGVILLAVAAALPLRGRRRRRMLAGGSAS